MKKTKLIMPLIGITATCASIAPLATLSSCSKQEYTVELSKGSKEQKLYANSKTLNLFFKQNNIENYSSTRVKMVNLKIDGAEASVVDGLTKLAVDAAGGMRVTLDITTMYTHYSSPSSIEFDLEFYNKENNTSYTFEGLKLNIDQETEVPNPFTKDATDPTIITGFVNSSTFASTDFASAYPKIFVEMTLPDIQAKITVTDDTDKDDQTTAVTTVTPYYKMVIPASFTKIDNDAFLYVDSQSTPSSTIPNSVVALEFELDSNMKTIGAGAFQFAPFIFVNLPSSIESLGESCFNQTSRLTSFQFAPTSTHKLTLQSGVLVNTAIPYLKLPNYVNTFSMSSSALAAISSSNPLVLDMSEWSPQDVASLNYTNGAISAADGSSIISANDSIGQAIIKKLLNSSGKANFQTNFSPFLYETPEGGTTAKIQMNSSVEFVKTFGAVLQKVSSYSATATKLNMPIWRYEFPNFYRPAEGTEFKINAINSDQYIQLLFSNSDMPSIKLPTYLASFPSNIFVGLSWLWQVHIPTTIEAMQAAAFSDDALLCSFIYDGTKKEWETLISKSDAKWITKCPAITVHCTDEDTTVKSTL